MPVVFSTPVVELLLVNPPFSNIGSPYPAIAHLAGYLRQHDYNVEQRDLGLQVFLKLFSDEGIRRLAVELTAARSSTTGRTRAQVDRFLQLTDRYATLVAPVIKFLQGHDETLARPLLKRTLIPEGPRFYPLAIRADVSRWYEAQTPLERARFLATHFLYDLFDVVRIVAPEFGVSRYGEQLLRSRHSFDDLRTALESDRTNLIDELITAETHALLRDCDPAIVGFSCPFPGTLYGTLRAARTIKQENPKVTTVIGGGFVNTELRRLSDERFFDYIDFVLYDDGEKPLQNVLDHVRGRIPRSGLLRTRYRDVSQGRRVVWCAGTDHDVPFASRPAPDYRGLPLSDYVALTEPGDIRRLAAERWNKIIAAHGCYWKRCTFCDTSLDYIGGFAPDSAAGVVRRMQAIHAQSGWTGFHFVDEAAPPALMKSVASRLAAEGLPYTWRAIVRFDDYFTPEVCKTLADGGCIAISGGIEVASPRLLKVIDKGVDLPQLARVTHAMSSAGIHVHGFLMYGFPTQTVQETIDSLEIVRQLFEAGCLRSAVWHRFVITAHSPIARDPAAFGITTIDVAEPPHGWFAYNTIDYVDPVATDHDTLGRGLRRALRSYVLASELSRDVREWFDVEVCAPTVPGDAVRNWIGEAHVNRATGQANQNG